MKSDPLFFRLFKELPECFFHLVGRSADEAKRYHLEAIEYKQTAVRLDGVFCHFCPKAVPSTYGKRRFTNPTRFTPTSFQSLAVCLSAATPIKTSSPW